jgi:hypothetical protein
MKNTHLILIVLVIAGFASCSRQQALNNSDFKIAKVFEKDILPSSVFELDAEKGGEFKTPTGTRIIVPAAAFTDENGNPVKGKVEIEFEEYHSAAEIIASGIPMTCKDQQGATQNLESAGMFSIQGKVGDKEVKIKEGKSIEVKVASNKEGDYDFFQLDLEGGNWQKLGSPEAEPNTEKTVVLANLQNERVQPVEPKKLTSDLPLVELKVDYSMQPQYSSYKNVFWELTGTPAEISKNKQLIASNKWTKFSLLADAAADGSCVMSVGDNDSKHRIKVLPVLIGKEYAKAQKAYAEKMEKFNEEKAKMRQLEMESNLQRSFAIRAFGTYNCDRYSNQPMAVRVKAKFEVDMEDMNSKQMSVFLIAGDAVINYTGSTEIVYNPAENNRLVAVLPGNEIAVLNAGGFKENVSGISNNGSTTFVLKNTGEVIKEISDLNSMVESL